MNKCVIFVGAKPFMDYVTNVVMQFTVKDADVVLVKARGRFISKAVDVVQVAMHRFLNSVAVVGDVYIGSEEYKVQDGTTVRVSNIEITIRKIGDNSTQSNQGRSVV